MNKNRQSLIETARQAETPFWTRIAEDLSKSSRRRRVVNLARINRVAKDGEVIIVPGKVLGDGELARKVTVVAHTFSTSAIQKLDEAKCKYMSIAEFLEKNPKGSGRIIG